MFRAAMATPPDYTPREVFEGAFHLINDVTAYQKNIEDIVAGLREKTAYERFEWPQSEVYQQGRALSYMQTNSPMYDALRSKFPNAEAIRVDRPQYDLPITPLIFQSYAPIAYAEFAHLYQLLNKGTVCTRVSRWAADQIAYNWPDRSAYAVGTADFRSFEGVGHEVMACAWLNRLIERDEDLVGSLEVGFIDCTPQPVFGHEAAGRLFTIEEVPHWRLTHISIL